MARPSVSKFPPPVAEAAARCFKAGETLRGVADAMDVHASSVLKALERGRQRGAPLHLKRMAKAHDASRSSRKELLLDLSTAVAQAETAAHPDGRWPA